MYSQPQRIPEDTHWWGIEARLSDEFGDTVSGVIRTQKTSFAVQELNLFTDMTVEARAIYDFNRDQVYSTARLKSFYTGMGGA